MVRSLRDLLHPAFVFTWIVALAVPALLVWWALFASFGPCYSPPELLVSKVQERAWVADLRGKELHPSELPNTPRLFPDHDWLVFQDGEGRIQVMLVAPGSVIYSDHRLTAYDDGRGPTE